MPEELKVGSGISVAKAGTLTENLKVTAYVLTNGNVGFYLLGNPVPLNKTLEGKVVKNGRGLNVVIDPDVYQPVPGLFTGITKLEVKFTAWPRSGQDDRRRVERQVPQEQEVELHVPERAPGRGKIDNKTSIACKSYSASSEAEQVAPAAPLRRGRCRSGVVAARPGTSRGAARPTARWPPLSAARARPRARTPRSRPAARPSGPCGWRSARPPAAGTAPPARGARGAAARHQQPRRHVQAPGDLGGHAPR